MDGVPKVKDRIIAGAGSIEAAVDALRGDDSADATEFVRVYDRISESDLSRLAIEEIFTAAGLTARRFVEVVTGALMQQSSDTTKMIVAVSQPKVMQATIKAATQENPIFDKDGEIVGYSLGDTKAMEIFHKMTGALPTPKGATTTIQLQQNNATVTKSESDEECDPPISMDEYLMELQDVVRPKALQAPVEPVVHGNVPVAEYVDVEV